MVERAEKIHCFQIYQNVMHWSEQGREIKRTVVASDKKGDSFVAVCVRALVGSSVPTVHALVRSEGPMRVTAGPLQGCSAGVGNLVRTDHGGRVDQPCLGCTVDW